MAEQVIRRGQDVMVQQSRPNVNLSGLGYPSVASLARYLFVSIPVTGIAGQTVVSAILSPRFRNATASQQLAVQPVAAAWAVDKISWSNQPGVRAASAIKVTGALADGTRTDIDITALVQQIANGQPHYGWRIATNGEAFFYGFATVDSWVLTIETSDAPNAPTTLVPDAGVIGRAKWVCRTDFTDLGGSTSQAAIQVQVDPNGTGSNPWSTTTGTTWDSGEVATTVPELDLSVTSYPGLANGATTKWRVRVKDTDGLWSPPSAWATVTRVIKPVLTVDSPTAGLVTDPTPTVQAHIASGTIKSWSVQVTEGADRTRIRYDSGRRPATGTTTFITDLPLRNDDGVVIFRDDQPHQIRVRVWDRLDRVQGGPDDPSFIEQWTTVSFDDDAAIAAPTSLTATNPDGSPRVLLTWTRPGSADAWMIKRDGAIIARLEPGEVTASGGTYSWIDPGSTPNESHAWQVFAMINRVAGAPRSVTAQSKVEGVWLLSAHGSVVLDGTEVDQLRYRDRRATYRLPNRRDDVDIIGAFEGLSGSYEGVIQYASDRPTEAAVDQARAIIKAIRADATTPVRLVYGTISAPVLFRGLSVTTSPDYLPNTRQHTVAWEWCWQVGDF